MNRGNWWILSIVLVGLIALAMEALERDEVLESFQALRATKGIRF